MAVEQRVCVSVILKMALRTIALLLPVYRHSGCLGAACDGPPYRAAEEPLHRRRNAPPWHVIILLLDAVHVRLAKSSRPPALVFSLLRKRCPSVMALFRYESHVLGLPIEAVLAVSPHHPHTIRRPNEWSGSEPRHREIVHLGADERQGHRRCSGMACAGHVPPDQHP